MTIDALLSLGGNMGDRKALMDAAIERLAALPGTRVTARSSYYRTTPDGPIAQDWFVNLAVAVRTDFDADALAAACRTIEADLGRDRSCEIPWGPRPIDIDVIAVGNDGLMAAPGGEFDRRQFVLVPLAEIAPATVIAGSSVASHASSAGRSGVEGVDWPVPPIAG
ncbi:MAG: 2-amino-4-hydroxy-6-hydroxymethyldihydropteridine diphosphokinase [Bauldia sp.]